MSAPLTQTEAVEIIANAFEVVPAYLSVNGAEIRWNGQTFRYARQGELVHLWGVLWPRTDGEREEFLGTFADGHFHPTTGLLNYVSEINSCPY